MDRLYRVAHGFIVERGGVLYEAAGDVFGAYGLGTRIHGGLKSLTLLAPVRPSKIVCALS